MPALIVNKYESIEHHSPNVSTNPHFCLLYGSQPVTDTVKSKLNKKTTDNLLIRFLMETKIQIEYIVILAIHLYINYGFKKKSPKKLLFFSLIQPSNPKKNGNNPNPAGNRNLKMLKSSLDGVDFFAKWLELRQQ